MQTSLDQLPASPFSILLTFRWGNGHVARYCRWTNDLTIGSETFTAEPSIRALFDKGFHGGSDDVPVHIEMRRTKAPLDSLIEPYPHAKVDVLIEEVSPLDFTSRAPLFTGRVGRIFDKPEGRAGLAKIKLQGVKRLFKRTAGIQALSTCAWTFGRKACLYDLAGNTLTGTVAELNVAGVPTRIRITIPTPTSMVNERWNRGSIQVDGLPIVIRKSFNDSGWTFDLREMPPPDWLGQACFLVPGCDKTIAVCRIHGQESQYLAVGYGTPTENPIFRVGTTQ